MNPSAVEAVTLSAGNPLRRYRLLSYFLIAYGFTWIWILVFLIGFGIPLATFTNIPVILGPTVAGFIMTYVMEGKAGVVHFLHRFVLWRVNVLWYLIALVGPAVILNLGMAVLPGAFATFTLPSAETVQGFPLFFILVLLIGGTTLGGTRLARLCAAAHGKEVGTVAWILDLGTLVGILAFSVVLASDLGGAKWRLYTDVRAPLCRFGRSLYLSFYVGL